MKYQENISRYEADKKNVHRWKDARLIAFSGKLLAIDKRAVSCCVLCGKSLMSVSTSFYDNVVLIAYRQNCLHKIALWSGQVFFFLKFKVFNVPSVARICSMVPQQDMSCQVKFIFTLTICKQILLFYKFEYACSYNIQSNPN